MLGGTRDFLFFKTIQTCSGAHPASYSKGTGLQFLGERGPGYEVDHSPPINAEVNNE
jgi:hypothetical protein